MKLKSISLMMVMALFVGMGFGLLVSFQKTDAPKADTTTSAKIVAPAPTGVLVKPTNTPPFTAPNVPVLDVAQDPVPTDTGGIADFLKKNWGWLVTALLGIFEVIARITPTEKDNTILGLIKRLLDNFFPNRNLRGSTHP